MSRFSILLCAVALTAVTPQQTIRGLSGRGTCVTHDGDTALGATTVNEMYGPWLRLTASYPAQRGQPAGTAVKFLGYDPGNRRWVVSSIDDSGGYYVIYSDSPAFNGSRWRDGYPADGGTANIRVVKQPVCFRRGYARRARPYCANAHDLHPIALDRHGTRYTALSRRTRADGDRYRAGRGTARYPYRGRHSFLPAV
ncbi:MAG TPA: hypothetical protein VGI19_03225 [Candidatus Cybelea sp.]